MINTRRSTALASAAIAVVMLGACTDGDTAETDDPFDSPPEDVVEGGADGVVDGTEDGFGPQTPANPEEGADIDSDGSSEVSPDEAEG